MSVKNPGPLLVSTLQGGLEGIPAPLRTLCKVVTITQQVPLDRPFVVPDSPVLETKFEQVAENERKATTTSISLPVQAMVLQLTPKGQTATTQFDIVSGVTTLTGSALTLDGSVTPIAPGSAVKSVTTVSALLPEPEYNVELLMLRDLWHRIPTTESSTLVAATVDTMPTIDAPYVLQPGELQYKVQQVTEFVQKRTKKTITGYSSIVESPLIFVGTERESAFGGAYLKVYEVISASVIAGPEDMPATPYNTTSTDFLVTYFSSDSVGAGLFLTRMKAKPSGTWAIITDIEHDPRHPKPPKIALTHQLVDPDAGIAAASEDSVPGVLVSFKAIDQYRGILTIETWETPAPYIEAVTVGHRYPRRVVAMGTSDSAFYGIGPAAKEVTVPARKFVSFVAHPTDDLLPLGIYSPPDANGNCNLLFPVNTVTIDLPGLHIGDALIDAYTLTISGVSIPIAASTPTPEQYLTAANAGAVWIIGFDRKPYHAGLWQQEVLMIPVL